VLPSSDEKKVVSLLSINKPLNKDMILEHGLSEGLLNNSAKNMRAPLSGAFVCSFLDL
jgi:hypothetical protein